MNRLEEIRMNIGKQLKAARLEAGLTITEVAEAINKTKNTVYSYEMCRCSPSADVLLLLMDLYNIRSFDNFLPNATVKQEANEWFSHPAYTDEESMNEFVDLLRNADEQSLRAVKAMLQVMQDDKPNNTGKIVNFNR